jgi:hypothetical protein
LQAVILTGHGGLDKLEYRQDWPSPEPGKDEVQIQVGACGLNNTDINTRTAWYSKSVTEGITSSGGKQGFDSVDANSGSWGSSALSFPRIQGAHVGAANSSVKSKSIAPLPVILMVVTFDDLIHVHFPGKTCFQSFFISTITQPFASAWSSTLSRVPTWLLRS